MIPLSTANVDISVNSPILSLNPEYIDHQHFVDLDQPLFSCYETRQRAHKQLTSEILPAANVLWWTRIRCDICVLSRW